MAKGVKVSRKTSTGTAKPELARFMVTAPEADRELLRWIAENLSVVQGDRGKLIREALRVLLVEGQGRMQSSGILEGLRKSPRWATYLDLYREHEAGRRVR